MMRDRDVTPTLTDGAIKAMFEHRAGRADAFDIRGPILAAALETSQQRRWAVVLPALLPPRLLRGLILALMAAAIVGLVVVGSGAFRTDPALKGAAKWFIRPFEYAILEDADIRVSGGPARAMISFAAGPTIAPEPSDVGAGGGWPKPTERQGIFIGSAETAWSHGADARYPVGTVPAEFLANLRDIGDVTMSDIEQTTVDGRPALAATLAGRGGIDIHVTGGGVNAGDYMRLTLPSRLIVADVDGETIFIMIWARTPDDLAAWLPTAESFVGSMHFDERSQP